MKGLYIGLAAVAVLAVAALGIVVIGSDDDGPRVVRDTRERPIHRIADSQVEEVPGDVDSELDAIGRLGQQVERAMFEGDYETAIELRREQIRALAEGHRVLEAAPLHLQIGWAETHRGNLLAAANQVANAELMAKVGGDNEGIEDDLALLRARISMLRGDYDETEEHLAQARQIRQEKYGSGSFEVVEMHLFDAYYLDLRADYEDADYLFENALAMLDEVWELDPRAREVLERNFWMFRSVHERREVSLEEEREPEHPAVKAAAAERLALVQRRLGL